MTGSPSTASWLSPSTRFALPLATGLLAAACGGGDGPPTGEEGSQAPAPAETVNAPLRSEESMPMLAELVERELGARTRICYALDDQGAIDPNRLDHIDGLEALEEADLMVLFTRFRQLPDEELARIVDFADSGRPVVGFRTSTHAFRYGDDDPRAATYNDAWPDRVFGAHWITHHGHFDDGASPLTSVELAPGASTHPILRGVEPFPAYSWLYHVQGGGDTLPEYTTELLFGEALRSSHVGREERFPRVQPVAWARNLQSSGGLTRVFFTTLGHPYDFKNTNMRRLALQGIAWAMGSDHAIPESGYDVTAEDYAPTNSGFGSVYTADVYPELERRGGADGVEITDGEVFALTGGALVDRLRFHPAVEATLRSAAGGTPLDMRNLGWNGDVVTRWGEGNDRFTSGEAGEDWTRPLGFPGRDAWLKEVGATTLLACYGAGESFDGEAGLQTFRADLEAWLDTYERRSFDGGQHALQVVLVGPTAHEDLGPPLPDGREHDADLARYSALMAEVAAERDLAFIDLHTPTRAAIDAGAGPLTMDGVQLNAAGYAVVADALREGLGLGDADTAIAAELEPLVATKDRLWFGRYRTLNSEYVHGRRYEPFGPGDFPQRFEALAAELAAAEVALDEAAARIGGTR
ncbi:MAG: ThuA domain-containing protein [Planctomycetota bacterium]